MTDLGLEWLRTKLGHRRVVPPLPNGAAARLPAEDDIESDLEGGAESVPLALYIAYIDAKGQPSERRIVCKKFDITNRSILAFCLERRAYRRFKVDRITACICSRTGEILEINDLFDRATAGIDGQYERLAHFLSVLIFLMQCDREAHPLEMEVIGEAANSYALRFDGDDSTVAFGCQLAARLAPDTDDMIRSLEWINRRPDRVALARTLNPFVERVIVADGRITSEEALFGGYVRDALRQITA